MVMMGLLVALGVVISPILRVEGMCPMAHFINIICSVLLGPWYSLLCAVIIGLLRMTLMAIPPLALTGAVFGAFLSGVFYRMSKGSLLLAVLGEVIGTGLVGAVLSYPVMTFLWGKEGLSWLFYIPSFFCGTLIGGSIAFLFLKKLAKAGLLRKFQEALGARWYVDRDACFAAKLRKGKRMEAKRLNDIREAVRNLSPLVHCITNPISIHSCADAILASGGRPVMAEHPGEAAEITETAQALLLNLGNITDVRMESMRYSAEAANRRQIPVVLDLVGIACSGLRRAYAEQLIRDSLPTVIKGNYSEIYAFGQEAYKSAGVDADGTLRTEDMAAVVTALAKQHRCIVLASGAVDIAGDGKRCCLVRNGHPQLSRITGTGCMLGALTACFLTAEAGIAAAVTACAVMGICGELSATERGNGSFYTNLMDYLSVLPPKELEKRLHTTEEGCGRI